MNIQAVRGMNDILPPESFLWQNIQDTLFAILQQYGYQFSVFPILESTDLFVRSIGEVTDIIEKEMYTFSDNNGDSLALRPEGTAGCARAMIEHGLLHHQMQRLYYMGPMFRHERPQKGRYRQFFQLGVETFGMSDYAVDAELILMTAHFWRALNISQHVRLQINTLGEPDARIAHRAALVDYFRMHHDQLDEDSQRRLLRNPLRILDSKNPKMQGLLEQAPSIFDYLDEASNEHFSGLTRILTKAGIDFEINPRLVRGLDYYNRTVFEWVTDKLGAQSTVCAGGRYDGLVECLGGRATSAVGFALGLERLITLTQLQTPTTSPALDYYVISLSGENREQALVFANQLRALAPGKTVLLDAGDGGFKNQFKRAAQMAAKNALVFGENECLDNTVTVKNLLTGEQQTLSIDAFLGEMNGR